MNMNKDLSQDVLHVAVVLTDADRHILWVNDGFQEMTGYSLPEVVGKKPSFLQGRNTDQRTIARLRHRLSQGEPFKEQVVNYRKDGTEYVCVLAIHPIHNKQGNLTNFIAFEINAEKITPDVVIPYLQVKQKYTSSSLSNNQELDIYNRLTTLFEEEKVYLDPRLKLRDIADMLETNTRYLSQVINNQTGNNILHFINSYRIEDAKEKIVSPDFRHLTTFGIAQTCGFKNKSTFYKVFRDMLGVTPRDFIKQHNAEEVRKRYSHAQVIGRPNSDSLGEGSGRQAL